MFFLFFKKPILTGERKKALGDFRKHAEAALNDLAKRAPDNISKQIYKEMLDNVRTIPILFFPRRSLREKIYSSGGRIFASVVQGEHVNEIRVMQRGNRFFIAKSDFIKMPAEHLFDGNKITVDGVFTLAHEYAHFPKPGLSKFARHFKLGYEQAEELMADVLSAKLAVKMGYPKEHVLSHFTGRGIVYGSFPFKKFISKAVQG